MSRTTKRGIDFSGWATNIFDDEGSPIEELLEAQGWNGFGVYFFLCQRAYSTDGYFCRWEYKNAITTARKMGGGIKPDAVRQVVSLCLRIGLFDKDLFARESILTNKTIQRHYMFAIEKRSDNGRTVNPDFWLLDEEETKSYILFSSKSHSLPEDSHSLPENSHSLPEYLTKESKGKQSKAKESTVQESTVKESDSVGEADRCAASPNSFNSLAEVYGKDNVRDYEQRFDNWKAKKGCYIKVDKWSVIAKWLKQDAITKPQNTSSFDMDEVMQQIINQYNDLS